MLEGEVSILASQSTLPFEQQQVNLLHTEKWSSPTVPHNRKGKHKTNCGSES